MFGKTFSNLVFADIPSIETREDIMPMFLWREKLFSRAFVVCGIELNVVG